MVVTVGARTLTPVRTLVIGRGGTREQVGWHVDDPTAEITHCELAQFEDGSVWLAPLVGVTCLNGTPVSDPTRIKEGDRILVGRTALVVPHLPKYA